MKKVLQIVHGYSLPFVDVANQYATFFDGKPAEITTLYLSGKESECVKKRTYAHHVIFWQLDSKTLKGLKLKYIARMYKLIKNGRYQMVICHRYKAIYLAAFSRLLHPHFTLIGVLHNFGYFRSLHQRLLLSLLKHRLYLIGVSNAIRNDIRQAAKSFPIHRVQTVYNSINLEPLKKLQLSKQEARQKLGLNSDDFIVGNVGRLHPDKDQTTLIKAFSLFHEHNKTAKLVIMGSGRLEQELKQLAERLDIHNSVMFTGLIENAASYFKMFDVYVSSSLREPFGIVLLEAMNAGVPIVCSDTGGAPEVVGETGYYFKQGNIENLAEVLQIFFRLGDKEKQELGKQVNARLVTHFTTDASCEQFASCPFNPFSFL